MNANAAKRDIPPAPTPTPIPALAPIDKPEDGLVVFEEEVVFKVVPGVAVGVTE